MYAIANNEHAVGTPVGYPFIISANGSRSQTCLKSLAKDIMLNARTADCHSEAECISLISKVVDKCGDNFDLGAFQINHHWHKLALADYFSLNKSYRYACDFVDSLQKKYGWNWSTIARYHSATEDKNKRYRDKLVQYFKKELYVEN